MSETKNNIKPLTLWKIPHDPRTVREAEIFQHESGDMWRLTCIRTDWLNTKGFNLPERSWRITLQVHNGNEWRHERKTLIPDDYRHESKIPTERYVIELFEASMIKTKGGSLKTKGGSLKYKK